MLVPWTPLAPSRREWGLRRLGRALAWLTALALAFAAFGDGALEAAALVGAVLAALAGVAAAVPRPSPPLEVGVDDAGALAVRRADGAAEASEQRLQCVFASPWLITLRRGTMWVRIWPDAVPGNGFRRFWVHIRWNPGRQRADRTASTAPVGPG